MCRRNALGICRVMGTRRNVAKLWRKYRNNAIYAKLKNVLYIFCYCCTSRLKALWAFCGFQLISMMQNKIIIKWLFFPLHLHCQIVYGITGPRTVHYVYKTVRCRSGSVRIRICWPDPATTQWFVKKSYKIYNNVSRIRCFFYWLIQVLFSCLNCFQFFQCLLVFKSTERTDTDASMYIANRDPQHWNKRF